uniref:Uncharacterized protein n=1 Tax=Romanomermis culicivorax TaxID=13658 RepID=A0A915L5C2_ROMCU
CLSIKNFFKPVDSADLPELSQNKQHDSDPDDIMINEDVDASKDDHTKRSYKSHWTSEFNWLYLCFIANVGAAASYDKFDYSKSLECYLKGTIYSIGKVAKKAKHCGD